MQFRRSAKKRRLNIMGLFSGLASLFGSAGGIVDKYLGSAYNAHLQRDLMSYQNNLNKENWYEQLTQGPTLQRRGLVAAGYNPLLALSGGVSSPSIGGVSALSASHGSSDGWDSFGRSMKDIEEASLVDDEKKVKRAQVDNLVKDNELKDALKDKAEADATKSKADATKTKVETFTEPARVVTSVLGAGATAYGAKKAVEAFKASKTLKADHKVIDLLGKSKKTGSAVRSVKNLLRHSPWTLAPLLGGAFSAKGTKTLMESARREGHWTDDDDIERNPKWIHGGIPVVP